MAPTRELVVQICKDADLLGKTTGLRVQPILVGWIMKTAPGSA